MRKRLTTDGNLAIRDQSLTRAKVVRRSGRDNRGRRTIKRPSEQSVTSLREPDDRDGRVGLLISDRCQSLIREFLGYKEEHVGRSVADDYCLDALRYACMGVAGQ